MFLIVSSQFIKVLVQYARQKINIWAGIERVDAPHKAGGVPRRDAGRHCLLLPEPAVPCP